jgi:cyclic pyranopterin phosphate synthase
MPEASYVWLPQKDLLSFEEVDRLTRIFTGLGVERVRLTGGEPLLRKDLAILVRLLAKNPAIKDLALTTNGVRLAELAAPLQRAGLHRLTVSLDTLRSERFRSLNQRDALTNVLAGIHAASRAGFQGLKIDAVVLRGLNEDELPDLIELGKETRAEVRFIEYMDVGGATRWSMDRVFPRTEILSTLEKRYGAIRSFAEETSAPAERHTLPDGTVFGIIASTTRPFCRSCDRSRLTADGHWYLCLYAQRGIDLRHLLREGASDAEIERILRASWKDRDDRGAEERLLSSPRTALVEAESLRRDPHLEMHTRGG